MLKKKKEILDLRPAMTMGWQYTTASLTGRRPQARPAYGALPCIAQHRNHRERTCWWLRDLVNSNWVVETKKIFDKNCPGVLCNFFEVERPFKVSLLQAGMRQVFPARDPNESPWFHPVTTVIGYAGSRHKCYFTANPVLTMQQNGQSVTTKWR